MGDPRRDYRVDVLARALARPTTLTSPGSLQPGPDQHSAEADSIADIADRLRHFENGGTPSATTRPEPPPRQ